MKLIKPLVVLVLVIIAVYFLMNRNTEEVVPIDEVVQTEEAREMCYIWNTEAGDSATLVMSFTGVGGSNVTGSFDFDPAEKDRKSGPFVGTAGPLDPYAMARTATLLWTASGEGVTQNEELSVVFGEGIANPGFGEMVQNSDGVYVYKNPSEISYSLNLSQTDCEDPAVSKF